MATLPTSSTLAAAKEGKGGSYAMRVPCEYLASGGHLFLWVDVWPSMCVLWPCNTRSTLSEQEPGDGSEPNRISYAVQCAVRVPCGTNPQGATGCTLGPLAHWRGVRRGAVVFGESAWQAAAVQTIYGGKDSTGEVGRGADACPCTARPVLRQSANQTITQQDGWRA